MTCAHQQQTTKEVSAALKRYTHIRERGDKYADWAKKTRHEAGKKGDTTETDTLMAAG